MGTEARGGSVRIDIASADHEHCVARYEHVLLLCWRDQVTLASLHVAREVHHAILKRHPAGVACLTVGTGRRMGDASMMEAARIARETYANVRWAACVVSGEGFVASAARAGLTSVLALAGQSSLVKVFRDLPSAAAWQYGHSSGLGIAPSFLTSAAQQVEAAMLSHQPAADLTV